jgi:hypothetical protein
LPREGPSFAILRCILLAIITWSLLIASIVTVFFSIIIIGRFTSNALIRALPAWFPFGVHDPLFLFIGLQEAALIINSIVFILKHWGRIRDLVASVPIRIMRRVILTAFIIFVQLPFLLGFNFRILFNSTSKEDPESFFRGLLCDLVVGQVICFIVWSFLSNSRVASWIDRSFGTAVQATFASSMQTIRALALCASTLADLRRGYTEGMTLDPPPRLIFDEPTTQAEVSARELYSKVESFVLFPISSLLIKAILLSNIGLIIGRFSLNYFGDSINGPLKVLFEKVNNCHTLHHYKCYYSISNIHAHIIYSYLYIYIYINKI